MLTSRQLRSSTGFAAAFSAALYRRCDIKRIGAACRCTDAAGANLTAAFSIAAARHEAGAQPAADAADSGGAFTSLHDAARSPAAVQRLDLTASPQLRCSNLLCDKVGEPCICHISRCVTRSCVRMLYGCEPQIAVPHSSQAIGALLWRQQHQSALPHCVELLHQCSCVVWWMLRSSVNTLSASSLCRSCEARTTLCSGLAGFSSSCKACRSSYCGATP